MRISNSIQFGSECVRVFSFHQPVLSDTRIVTAERHVKATLSRKHCFHSRLDGRFRCQEVLSLP